MTRSRCSATASVADLLGGDGFGHGLILLGDLLFEGGDDGRQIGDLLFPLGDLRTQRPQFAAARNQSGGGRSLADDQRAIGGENFAGQRDEIQAAAGRLRSAPWRG